MKNYQAVCEDHWKSKIVQANTPSDAADMVTDELVTHVKKAHSMDLPTDPVELHKSVVDHMQEVQ